MRHGKVSETMDKAANTAWTPRLLSVSTAPSSVTLRIYPALQNINSDAPVPKACHISSHLQLSLTSFLSLTWHNVLTAVAPPCQHTHTHTHTHTHAHTHAAHHLSPCGKIRKILSIVMKTNTECVQSSTVSPEHFFHINSAPSP